MVSATSSLWEMKGLSLLIVCVLPSVAFSCSCDLPVSRKQTIKDFFCSEYSRPDVYTARVVGATCNCIPPSGDANLQCQDYTFTTGSMSVVNVEVTRYHRLCNTRQVIVPCTASGLRHALGPVTEYVCMYALPEPSREVVSLEHVAIPSEHAYSGILFTNRPAWWKAWWQPGNEIIQYL